MCINYYSVFKITSLIFQSPDLNPLDFITWGAILGRYCAKPTNIAELKTAVRAIDMEWQSDIVTDL